MRAPRVIIVEDELILSLALRMNLKLLGLEVVGSAVSGEEAIPLLRRERPDLCLLDIRLAGKLTGLDVAQAALAEPEGCVAFMSAYDFAELKDLPVGDRVLARLPKPISESSLAGLVRSLEARSDALGRGGGRDGAGAP